MRSRVSGKSSHIGGGWFILAAAFLWGTTGTAQAFAPPDAQPMTVGTMRLAIGAGEAVRFDPGSTVTVGLAPIGGERIVIGFAGLVDGPLDAPGAKDAALAKARATGYLDTETPPDGGAA